LSLILIAFIYTDLLDFIQSVNLSVYDVQSIRYLRLHDTIWDKPDHTLKMLSAEEVNVSGPRSNNCCEVSKLRSLISKQIIDVAKTVIEFIFDVIGDKLILECLQDTLPEKLFKANHLIG
jgi:hypothetical protein